MVSVGVGLCGNVRDVASLLHLARVVGADPRLHVRHCGTGALARNAGRDHVYPFRGTHDRIPSTMVAVAVLVSLFSAFDGVGITHLSLDFPGVDVGDSENKASSSSDSRLLDFRIRCVCVQHLYAAVVAWRADFKGSKGSALG